MGLALIPHKDHLSFPCGWATRRSIDDLCSVRLYGLEFVGITMGEAAPSMPAAGWRCPRENVGQQATEQTVAAEEEYMPIDSSSRTPVFIG